MAWLTDHLRNAIAAINPFARTTGDACLPNAFTHQLALAAYLSSGMLRKVIRVPADDRVREWRDWQAEKEQIAAIEAEERRLNLVGRVRFAELMRGIGGGALILVTEGDHATPLNPESLRPGGLVAVNAVSRWQIQGIDWVRDLASPDYQMPAMFRITGANGAQQAIHPSRVVCFRGDPLPSGPVTISEEEHFWGDSRLLQVFREVQKADNAALWFSDLIRKAKLLRIGIPDLDSMDSDRVSKRVALIAEGEGILNATVYRSSANAEDGGEKVDDFQVNWTGMPAMMDAFDQRVAAVADIPFTRLMGRSPAGLNATGKHDDGNWNKMVSAGQKLETRPCLDQVDPVLLKSAGVVGKDITWAFAPLDVPTEAEQATTFKTTMDAVVELQNTGAIPEEAFARGLQNLMIEREWMPGLDQALDDIPEDERYGVKEDPALAGLGDPSALQAANENTVQQMVKRGAVTAKQADSLLLDASPRTLYVSRQLLNAAEFIEWAKGQGFETTTPADDLHVTICFSKQPVDWMKMGSTWDGDDKGNLTVAPGGARIVERLGDKGAAVLLFSSSALSWRHEEMIRNGASFDFDQYQPHVTITYQVPDGLDLSKVEPYRGKLVFGPEIFVEVVEDWEKGITEDGGRPQAAGPFEDAKRRHRGGGRHGGFHAGQLRGPDGRWITTGASEEQIREHVGRALRSGKEHSTTSLGEVSHANAEAVHRHTGVSIHGHERVLESSDIRHTHNSHGDPQVERARNQVAVTRADYARIPQIVEHAHHIQTVGAAGSRKGLRLEYHSRVDGHEYRYVELVRQSGRIVSLKTMKKLPL